MEEIGCWVCDEKDIVYTDVLGLGWCQTCYDELYLEKPK